MSSPVVLEYQPTSPREVNSIDGSHAFDEDTIAKQLQSDLERHTEAHSGKQSKKDKKRKSRDAEVSGRSGADDTPSKKRKKKRHEQARQEAQLALDSSYKIVRDSKDGVSFKPEVHLNSELALIAKSTPQTANHGGRPMTHIHNLFAAKPRRRNTTSSEVKTLVAPSRSSLGSNLGPLLQSILKDCSPNRIKQLRALNYTGLTSDIKCNHNPPEVARDGTITMDESSGRKPYRGDNLVRATEKMIENVHGISKVKTRPKSYTNPKLPVGYEPGAESSKKEYHCPVEGCDKLYIRKRTLGEHMHIVHADQDLYDNYDGTFTVMSKKEKVAATSKNKAQLPGTGMRPPILPKSRPRSPHAADSPIAEMKAMVDREFSMAFSDGHRSEAFRATECQKSTKTTAAVSSEDPQPTTVFTEISEDDSKSAPDTTVTISKIDKATSLNTNRVEKAKASQLIGSDSIPDGPLAIARCASAMEDWELSPGIMRRPGEESDGSQDGEDCVAFSSAFIHSLPHGVKASNINFRVIHLFSGASETLNHYTSRLRICSVAAGKVMVQAADTEFHIGANGMWMIKPKEKCAIRNLCHSEAIIHVSTLPKF